MRRLSGTLQSAVDQNFEAGGRPAWLGIKYRSGTPLINKGTLRNSIKRNSYSDSESAVVGTNIIYAPIHHYGGVIKPKKAKWLRFKASGRFVTTKEVNIPARPFLVLTPEDEDDLLEDAQDYFASLITSQNTA
ncbi:phage virion morphogenesis protein [Pasteurellaceae bacterium 15-036681]|nr:phage virion morphogenesis protein [Pasteurellaceae bacterium 15-036681]